MTPWEFAGLDQMTFSHLPWKKKRAILLRFRKKHPEKFSGKPIEKKLPYPYNLHPYGPLLYAWQEYLAEKEAV